MGGGFAVGARAGRVVCGAWAVPNSCRAAATTALARRSPVASARGSTLTTRHSTAASRSAWRSSLVTSTHRAEEFSVNRRSADMTSEVTTSAHTTSTAASPNWRSPTSWNSGRARR